MDAESEAIWVVDVDSSADPRGEMLQALLRARFAYERAHAARAQWFKLLLFLLACVAAGAAGRAGVIADHWAAILGVSGLLLARALAAATVEWSRHRRWVRLVGEHGGVRLLET